MRSCGKMYGTELFTLDMPQITSNRAVHWVYRIIRDPEYKRYQLVCTKRVLDPTTFLTFLLRALVGWHPIKCRFIIISSNKYVHGWFSSWPPINVVVTKKRYMQMNTKERPSKPFLLFLMCMFQTKRGSLVQTHLKMDVVERWTIQTINEQMGIPTMNDYVFYVGETPRVDFCAQVLEKHFAIQSKIMKVPPHSYGKFTTQLYHDQSSREYIYIEPQQFWEGSVQLKPSTEHAPPKTKL